MTYGNKKTDDGIFYDRTTLKRIAKMFPNNSHKIVKDQKAVRASYPDIPLRHSEATKALKTWDRAINQFLDEWLSERELRLKP
jgi:hypothetical protein